MNFFRILKDKIWRQPDRNFDQRFWARFEGEFAAEPAKSRSWIPKEILRWAAVPAMIVLAIGGYLQYQRVQEQNIEEAQQVAELMVFEPVVAELELFEEFEDLPESESEWEVLVPSDNAGEARHAS